MLQVTEIAAQVGPSVVGLGRGWGRGSGVVVAPGRVVTNAHVLRGPDVAVTVGGGAVVHGRVVGADARADLAVIEADTGDAPAVPWAEGLPGIGTLVFALADPGGRGLRVTQGHVAAVPGRAIEHTAPVPRGGSGSPLVDGDGALLGLNTARVEGGFVLALPARVIRARVDALARGETMERPRLGVALGRGMVVRAIKDASPAAVAGIAVGDRFVAVDDRPLRAVDDLLDALEAGGPFTLTVVRGTEQRDVSVVLQ
jgi:serine protease Do